MWILGVESARVGLLGGVRGWAPLGPGDLGGGGGCIDVGHPVSQALSYVKILFPFYTSYTAQ